MIDDFRDMGSIDRIIHEPSRLIILAVLYSVESADFLYLLRETGLTKGNLSAHLSKLEDAGYITIDKTFVGKIPRTTCHITEAGREAFRQYRERMKRIVNSMPE